MGAALCRRFNVLHFDAASAAFGSSATPGTMSLNKSDWIIIGISGVTCGGKTSLANRLRSALWPAHVFHQDAYFLPDTSPQHVRCARLPHNDYDVLSALDMERMLRDVTLTIGGTSRAHEVELQPAPHKLSVPGKSFLIAEGFTVLNYPPLMELCDLRYYFILEYGECLSRRVHRLYDPPDIAGYFELCVWPRHLAYRAQIEKDHRVKIIDGAKGNAFEIVMDDLRALQT